MNKRILGALLGILAGSLVSTANADDGWTPGTTHMVLDAGLGFGGDTVDTVVFSDGTSKSLHGGDGLFSDFGVQHNFDGSNWSLKGTFGFDVDAVAAKNATISFARLPVDVLAIYTHGDHHFGLGLTEHLSPRVDNDGYGADLDFNNATGFMLQYQYWLFGIRYTNIKYKLSTISTPFGNATCVSGCSRDGSSIGLFFNYVF